MSLISTAKFISADPEWGAAVPKFKKNFKLKKDIRSATLEITALGVYAARINGERVGDFILAPGWTEYEKRVQYQKYDVTDMLKAENTIEVGVGHGWYCSAVGFDGIYPISRYPAFAAALHITCSDGSEQIIATDESWLAARSETLSSTIYGGERTDARIVPSFSEHARIFEFDKKKLVKNESVTVRETERIKPIRIITTPKGESVIDFGQNLTGYVEFKVCGKAGDTVRITCAEILDRDGNFYNENYRSAESLIEYTLKDGEQTYKPLYTFFGFRYLRLENWCEEIAPENFTAISVHSDIRRTGYFESGHTKLNRLYENVIRGQRGNFLDVPTDCPQRDERLGWTGDAQVFCRTAMLNFDCNAFFKKWLRDLALAQHEDGAIPRVIPNTYAGIDADHNYQRISAAWADAATVCPYEHFMAYGDKKFLCEMFPTMKKWVSYIEENAESYIWCSGSHYGDWLALDKENDRRGATEHPLIATAFFYYSAKLTAKAARIIGEDSAHYDELLPKIKEAFLCRFTSGERLTSDTQTAYALAIQFGLCDGDIRTAFGNRLIELIEERGDTLTTGFVGTPYLLDALTEIGRVDKAYTLLLQEKFPSWLYSVNRGATTIWEHWDGINENGEVWSSDMNSFNHYAYGSVASWLYRTVCGIVYDEEKPAYKHFFLRPIPSERLGYAKARIKTDFGDIVSEWKYEDGNVKCLFEVPKGTSATLTLGEKVYELNSGKYTFQL